MPALALAGDPALSTPDAVVNCRAEHAREAPEYVRCLEMALEARDNNSDDSDLADQDAPPAATSDEDPVPNRMGAEQVRDAQDEQLSVRIVGTTYNPRGLGTFRMEDGEVWRETTASPERKHLEPDRRYTARIVRGKLGGYRMHVDGVRWMKTVERIE